MKDRKKTPASIVRQVLLFCVARRTNESVLIACIDFMRR